MDTSKNFGDYLREIRESQGLTQNQLAEKMGTVQPQISRLERGAREPSSAELRLLRDLLGLDANHALDLLGACPNCTAAAS